MKPTVIIFEGIDCSGKSNIIRLISNELDPERSVVLKAIDNVENKNYRDLLVNKDLIIDINIRATLYNDAISECYNQVLTNIALKQDIILLDRSHISMFAYQHKANPINIFNNSYTKVRWEKILATCNVVFIYLNVDENILKERYSNKEDKDYSDIVTFTDNYKSIIQEYNKIQNMENMSYYQFHNLINNNLDDVRRNVDYIRNIIKALTTKPIIY